MRKIIYGLFLLAGVIMSAFGINTQNAQAAPEQERKPVVRKASGDMLVFSDALNRSGDELVAAHYSHRSHSSHSSHSSHYSSRF